MDLLHNVTIKLLYSELKSDSSNSIYSSSLSMHSSSIVLYSAYTVLAELKLINYSSNSINIDMLTHNTS